MDFWENEEVPNLKEYLDLVAIGTIADVMPLHGDNRILTRAGLEVLAKGQRPGIYALKMISRIGSPVTTEDICFRISPRINAAGRMDHAYEAFRLLVEDNEARAFNLAQGLQRLNQDRQNEEAGILRDAKNIISSMGDRESYVLFNPEWKKGIVGIVAGKLSEQLSKPVILFALDGDYVHGSGRSPDAFNLYEILSECSSFLDSFGGHRVAAGVHLKTENLKDFSQAFEAHVSERAKDIDPTRGITLDFPIQLSEILDPAFQEFYGLMEPFGQGFKAPLLAINDYSLCSASVVGKGHLKLILSETFSANDRIELIGWGHGDKVGYMWDDMEIACVPLINEWSGRKRLELRLKDARYREGNL
jgi:single-stranded-DNA-specific exonuclease